MTWTTNTSVSQSTVYRSLQGKQAPPSSFTGMPSEPAADSNKKSFLQRLLAIEEEHDRKRMARLCRRGNVETDLVENFTPYSTDSRTRWTSGQILDDTPDENQSPDFTGGQNVMTSTSVPVKKFPHHPLVSSFSSTPSLPPISQASVQATLGDSSDIVSNIRPNPVSESTPNLATFRSGNDDDVTSVRTRRKRHLRLPPILLPRVYMVNPRPLQVREFLTPTKIRGPITEGEWEDLRDCRYIRHALPRFALQVSPSSVSLQS